MSPYLATLLTFAIAIFFLRLMDFLAQRGVIESRLSRKLIHIGTGPIFVLCWLMTMFVFSVYVWAGAFSGPMTHFLAPVTWIALGAMVVESLPFKDIDNITIALASVLVGHLVF